MNADLQPVRRKQEIPNRQDHKRIDGVMNVTRGAILEVRRANVPSDQLFLLYTIRNAYRTSE